MSRRWVSTAWGPGTRRCSSHLPRAGALPTREVCQGWPFGGRDTAAHTYMGMWLQPRPCAAVPDGTRTCTEPKWELN